MSDLVPVKRALISVSDKTGLAEFARHPVGSGPFMFKEWVTKDHVTLVKNPDYNWGSSYFKHTGPAYLDQVIFKVIPEESVRILQEVGQWMSKNGDTIYKSDHCQPRRSAYASYTRTGNTLFMHVHYWPGGDVNMCGLRANAKSVQLYATKQKVDFKQDPYQLHVYNLPQQAPDHPVTTLAIECDSEPTEDNIFVRKEKPRDGV